MKSRINNGIIGVTISSINPGGVYSEDTQYLAELSGTWPNVASVATPTIVSIVYANSTTSANPAGGETITLNGYNFLSTSTITVNGVSVTKTYVSANQLTFVTNSMVSEGNYVLVVNNPSTSLSTTSTISFTKPPIFTTPAGSLGTFTPGATVSIPISVYVSPTETATVTFASGTLPSGMSFNTYTNLITGTAPILTSVTSPVVYTFALTVTNTYNQTTTQTFTISIIAAYQPAAPSGGTPSSDSNYNYMTFTSSGTLSITQSYIGVKFNYILIGQGGSGGGGACCYHNDFAGGGGAGGVVVRSCQTLTGSYTVTISGNTTAFGLTALQGGQGGSAGSPGGSGGSGGGGGGYTSGTASGGCALQPSSSSGGYGASGGYGGGGAGGGASYTWIDGKVYAQGGAGGGRGGVATTPSGYGSGGGGGRSGNGYAGAAGNPGALILAWPLTTGVSTPSSGTIIWINPTNNSSFTYYQYFAITNVQLNAYTYYGDTQTYTASGLPTGLSLSSSGLLSGTPTASGTYTTTFTVTSSYNSVASSITVTYTIIAEFVWVTPTSGSTISNFAQAVSTNTYTLSGTPAQLGDATYTYSSSNLPAGLSISGNQIVGTPTNHGTTNNVVITATSTLTSGTTSVTFNMAVANSPVVSATGGCVSTCGNYKIHTFTSGGTFSVGLGGTVQYVLVGGGGNGAGGSGNGNCNGGGGGAGGYLAGCFTVNCSQTYTIGIGAGGGAGGSNTTAFCLTAYGGGAGGGTAGNGASGGGGGSGYTGHGGGLAIYGSQGHNGGSGTSVTNASGGGGGGAGSAGGTGGAAGSGVTVTIVTPNITVSVGGSAGQNATGAAGAANRGNGGAGADGTGGHGGSGIVILKYKYQ